MTDHIAAVRAQAEKERARRFGRLAVISGAHNIPTQTEFIDGAVWLASRLTREKIADAITNRPTGQSAADAVLGLLERGDNE